MKQVVCAMIFRHGKLLVARHGENSNRPWKWEFPGGKVQLGESPTEALVREIREELNVTVRVDAPLEAVVSRSPGHEITLMPFLCRIVSGEPELREHAEIRWIELHEVTSLEMLPADYEVMKGRENLRLLSEYAGEEA